MNGTRMMVLAGVLGIGGILGPEATPARAQAYARPTVYYYPSPGYYGTTDGTVYIAVPGYYSNVPAPAYAAPNSVPSAGAYRPMPTYGGRVFSGGAIRGGPAYYSGAQHSLHGRGWNSDQHGRR
jgi:hypothetical protein